MTQNGPSWQRAAREPWTTSTSSTSQYFAADLEVEAENARIAENVATQIATRLAIWFRQQAAKQTG